ncbi:hypothetical protein ONS95_007833 [Cadophora gregata]|uniref:uncharacterized protein n=1 Tax=Cadophora gregata TaxID=51156 RepID=UPI0026DC8EF1|nr:uncharacterized protein ONS95_007833 [Cadophora gregata]KAK0118966.1 hypothetical protein ONS96_012039 [Cadophora gregata f. sp. sojae]KAK0126219.1 hypothetical protein ONS95_007833 [Cadophora gregata]
MPPMAFTPALQRHTPCWEVLELGHPGHLECYNCKKLHPITDVLAHPESWSKCRTGDRKLRVADYIHPNFDLLIFRIIMKQHRQGQDQRHLLELLTYRGKATIEDAQVKQFIAEPRIANGSLLMRSQTTYVVPYAQVSNQEYLFDRNLLKCPHTCRWSPGNSIVTNRLHRWVRILKSLSEDQQEHIMDYRCDFCPTEFNVSLERLKGQGVVLRILKWQDIGTGLSPVDEDIPSLTSRGLHPCFSRKYEKVSYESPRTRFEGAEPGGDPAALSQKEREELFALYSTWRAKLLRCRDKVRWPLLGYGRPFPQHYGPYYERQMRMGREPLGLW